MVLIYSTAEYSSPCRSVYTFLLDRPVSDDLRIVIGCMKPTLTAYLPVLPNIPPAELRQKGATLSLARRPLDLGHTL